MPILHWLDRDTHTRAAEAVPYRLLEALPEHSAGDANTENMLIQGDNLEALKALLPYYAGRVKCIFIDPPYNTKSAVSDHYDDNLEHSQWLGMMFPRLKILYELMASDGLIFVQIDDNEMAYLTVIMDEIFGRSNRLNCISVKMSESTGVKMTHARKRFPKTKEHILVYKKQGVPNLNPIKINLEKWNDEYKEILLNITEEDAETIKDLMDEEKSDEASVGKVITLLRDAKIVSLSKFFKENNILDEESQDIFKWENAWRIVQAVGAGSIKERALQNKVVTQDVSALLSSKFKLYLFKTNFDHTSKDPRIRVIFADKYLQYNPGDFWPDIKTSGGVGQEGGILFKNGKKPEALVHRIIKTCTNSGDIILDSFLGSGTTAAVAHKMNRRYIGIEMGDHALTHCVPRLKKVIDGEQGGISQAVNWQGGGGFRFYRLGETVFDESGQINPAIRFAPLAAHIWFTETRQPLPGVATSPRLGVHEGVAYDLLYNGVLGDKRPDAGNVLTQAVLSTLPPHDGPRIIYGEASCIGPDRLKSLGIVFKQTPYDVKAR